ncbi:MAG TPA: glutathione-regulated potassium-efflux system oxidoreductase KefF [Polyangiaceae bacterium]|nr:glutathione-regulated potassium-efflux system oxidoreductase KefF [Polyangiaceae bacterium]
MVVLVFAHPYPDRSRANRRLLDAVKKLDDVEVRSLYDLYPGFDIDVAAEQAALEKASTIVWQHPTYWYTVPGLMKHWFDKVLLRGWAYGEGGTALRGKRCLWVPTTGGDDVAYTESGMHGRAFESYIPVVEQTAVFCGLRWETPLIVQGVHDLSDEALDAAANNYRARLEALIAADGSSS